MNKKYADYLQSDEWRKIAQAVKDRDNNACVLCGSTTNIQAHHKTYEHIFKEDEHLEDLITLCNDHHEMIHLWEKHSNEIRAMLPNLGGTKKKAAKKKTAKKKRRKKGTCVRISRPPSVIGTIIVPKADSFVLTGKLIDQLKTPRGGFSQATVHCLGSKGMKNWKRRVIGTTVTKDQYRMAAEMSGRRVL